MQKKEEQMALALQMAAVNNSILALVNQHREIINEERVAQEARDCSPRGGDSERDEIDDDHYESNDSRMRQERPRYRSEADAIDPNPATTNSAMEMHRENGNNAVTQSPIQART